MVDALIRFRPQWVVGRCFAMASAVFVVLLNRFFWKKVYRLAEERYAMNV